MLSNSEKDSSVSSPETMIRELVAMTWGARRLLEAAAPADRADVFKMFKEKFQEAKSDGVALIVEQDETGKVSTELHDSGSELYAVASSQVAEIRGIHGVSQAGDSLAHAALRHVAEDAIASRVASRLQLPNGGIPESSDR